MNRVNKRFCKTLQLCILFLGTSFLSYGQQNQTSLKLIDSIAKQMFVDVNNKNFDAILEMTHPKVFDLVPKESMKTVIKSMFEGNDEFSIEIPNEIPDYKLSDVFSADEDNLEYAFLSYDMKMNMTFKGETFEDEAKEMMISMMKTKGMDVEFISDNTMKVLMRDRLTIILNDDNTEKKWVMINYDPDSPLFYQVLSSNLLEKAKEYNQDLMLESKKKREN